ncbi:TonB-dependent siderophore receptor [Thermosulfurimonas sp. F29]|uniref:TonB-dependent receptor plug domain-containing protein n=1 Tax=Thermosulfurimonas sp. F29 TaxID=2867247 RepID=UPI001C8290A5|nr:TonB-dependent receptor [Thermosulfurimonas sp. F29]MBX6423112.1 TonB-dependent receptor [Thermosulfurimonas sp. F29]
MGRVVFLLLLALGLFPFKAGAGEVSGSTREIVITATKTPHPLEEVPVETYIITQKDIESSSSQTVSDLLRYVPGIFVRDEDAPGISAWRALIRGLGFNEGYGLILLDGERVRGEGMGDSGIGLNQIPPQMIERIEIVEGPASVLYGSDALAGVVNIITKEIPERTIYGFEGGYGSYDTNLQYLYWGTREDPWGLLLQVAREESEMGAYGVKNNRNEDYERQSFMAKWTYKLGEGLLAGLKMSVQQDERHTDYRTQDTFVVRKAWKYRISPYLKFTLSNDSELFVRAYYYDWKFTAHSRGTDPYPYALYRGDMYYRVVESRYTKPVGELHLLTVGAEYRNEELDYTFSHRKMDIYSIYLQDELELFWKKPFNLVLGSRLDHHSVYGTEICPKVSLLFKVTPDLRLRASIGRGFKAPTIRQAFYTEPYPHGHYFYVSNPDLDAETSWGCSLGLEKIWRARLRLGLSLFRNDVKHMIIRYYTYRDINGDGMAEKIRTFKNARKAYTQGAEVYVRASFFEDFLRLNLAYTYTDTEDKDTGKELPFVPHHVLAAHVILTHQGLGLTFDLGFQFASELYTNTDNTERNPSYSVVDIKILKHVGRVVLSLEGNNIFNSDYGEPDRTWWGATWLLRARMDF